MQDVFACATRSASFMVAISLAFPATGLAQASPDGWPDKYLEHSAKREWPDGPNKEFLKNLMRPDNHKFFYREKHSLSCCDAGDTVKPNSRSKATESIQRIAGMLGLTMIG
jgi:hypothetical protein